IFCILSAAASACTKPAAPPEQRLDGDKRPVVSAIAAPTAPALFPIQVNKKFGYINREGTFVIRPQFDYAAGFVDGYAEVCIGTCAFVGDDRTGFGFIDATGNVLGSLKYGAVGGFHEDRAAMCMGSCISFESTTTGQWGFVDSKGTEVIPPQFSLVGD